MRTLKTFMIFGLAVLLLGFMISCKKVKNPYSPDIPKIIDGNDNNDPCDCCVNEITVEYIGTPIMAKTCRWEVTLKSIERFEFYEKAPNYGYGPQEDEYILLGGAMVIAKYRVKNAWEKEYFRSDIPRSAIIFGMFSTYPTLKSDRYEFYLGADGNASFPTYYYKPNPSGPMEVVPDFCQASLKPDEEIEIVDSFKINLFPEELEWFFNSSLTLEFSGDGMFAIIHPEAEGKTGCGYLEQIIKFRLLTII